MKVFTALGLLLFAGPAFGQPPSTVQPPRDLKKLSIDELQEIEVTSVSRRPEKLLETASAIQVITADDIRRAGATSVPEALRLASNLQVAQVDSRSWAISARGFNGTSANKLLVLIDGRVVYTPLHAAVFWEVQDALLESRDAGHSFALSPPQQPPPDRLAGVVPEVEAVAAIDPLEDEIDLQGLDFDGHRAGRRARGHRSHRCNQTCMSDSSWSGSTGLVT